MKAENKQMDKLAHTGIKHKNISPFFELNNSISKFKKLKKIFKKGNSLRDQSLQQRERQIMCHEAK